MFHGSPERIRTTASCISVRVNGHGSGPHLASVLLEGRNDANVFASESSGESWLTSWVSHPAWPQIRMQEHKAARMAQERQSSASALLGELQSQCLHTPRRTWITRGIRKRPRSVSSQTGRTTDTKEADHDRQYYSGTESDRRRSVDHQRLRGSGQRPAFGNNGL